MFGTKFESMTSLAAGSRKKRERRQTTTLAYVVLPNIPLYLRPTDAIMSLACITLAFIFHHEESEDSASDSYLIPVL